MMGVLPSYQCTSGTGTPLAVQNNLKLSLTNTVSDDCGGSMVTIGATVYAKEEYLTTLILMEWLLKICHNNTFFNCFGTGMMALIKQYDSTT